MQTATNDNLVWPIFARESDHGHVGIILNNRYCLTSKYLRHLSETGPHLFQPTSFPVSRLLYMYRVVLAMQQLLLLHSEHMGMFSEIADGNFYNSFDIN